MIDEFGEMVYLAAFRILRDRHEVEDVVQETFFYAWQHRNHLEVENWGGWLRRLATCRAIDRRRECKAHSFEPAMLEQCVVTIQPDALHEQEFETAIQRAIAELPAQQGEAFCLRYFEHMGNQEIASLLGTSVSAVSTALHKARQRLASQLHEFLQGDSK